MRSSKASARDLDPVVHDTRASTLSYTVSFGKGAAYADS